MRWDLELIGYTHTIERTELVDLEAESVSLDREVGDGLPEVVVRELGVLQPRTLDEALCQIHQQQAGLWRPPR